MKTLTRRFIGGLMCMAVTGLTAMSLFGQALDKTPPPPPRPEPVPDLLKPVLPPPPKLPPVPAPSLNRLQPGQVAPAGQPLSTVGQLPPGSFAPALHQGGVNAVPQPSVTTPPDAVVWDKEFKELTTQAGDTNVLITYHFTNTCSSDVIIRSVRPSCGCTTMQLPTMPWTIPSGSNGSITASLDLRGKYGVLTKSVMVDSSSGYKSLMFKVSIPQQLVTTSTSGQSLDPDRVKNMQLAQVDRQVVFKNQDCAKCHAEPARGKMGEELYVAACAICHDTPNRATMVPDLKALKFPTSPPYWKYWTMNGRPGSLMPAFAQSQGGPLTEDQIQSLANYLTETITRKAVGATPVGAQPSPVVLTNGTPRASLQTKPLVPARAGASAQPASAASASITVQPVAPSTAPPAGP